MTDQNITATPYPFYATGGNDNGEAFKAALTSHVGASVERNQDAQFSAGRDLAVTRDVVAQAKDVAVAVLENRVEMTRLHGDLKAELAAVRAEALQRDLASLRDASIKAQNDGLLSALGKIATKLGI